ncbi:MAG: hypothetical protein JJT94_00525 [Bernardetiaceae bacterium]|nr:hypothetical protein [Bernardetiaceae bacterium]
MSNIVILSGFSTFQIDRLANSIAMHSKIKVLPSISTLENSQEPLFKPYKMADIIDADSHKTIEEHLGYRFDYKKRIKTPLKLWKEWRNYNAKYPKKARHHVRLLEAPEMLFALAYLADNYKVDVIFLICSPFTFIANWKNKKHSIPLKQIMSDTELLIHFFEDSKDSLLEQWQQAQGNAFEEALHAWKLMALLAIHYRRSYPNWIFLQKETFVNNPKRTLYEIYDVLGLQRINFEPLKNEPFEEEQKALSEGENLKIKTECQKLLKKLYPPKLLAQVLPT